LRTQLPINGNVKKSIPFLLYHQHCPTNRVSPCHLKISTLDSSSIVILGFPTFVTRATRISREALNTLFPFFTRRSNRSGFTSWSFETLEEKIKSLMNSIMLVQAILWVLLGLQHLVSRSFRLLRALPSVLFLPYHRHVLDHPFHRHPLVDL
jgi:hypothetical protein